MELKKIIKSVFYLSTFILWTAPISAQNGQFVTPLEAEYGKDFIIVNYVDWGGVKDHQCGTKTYKGHQGTDMVLRSFPQMDSGVYVLAADTGVVTFIHDGEYDRNTKTVPPLGFGNYIAIRHPNKMYSYYAHLKKNSMLVQVGETVSPGQRIAEVGSSGNSTDPHLHFETWFDSLYLVDPFQGPCGNPITRWKEPLPYDTSYKFWEGGMMNFIPTVDSLRFRVQERTVFTPEDSIITFWGLQYGLRKGATSKVIWKTPDNQVWFTFKNNYKKDWWYYYYFTYIRFPQNPQWGQWTIEYYYEDSLVHVHHFILQPSLSTQPKKVAGISIRYEMVDRRPVLLVTGRKEITEVLLYEMAGRRVPIELFKTSKGIRVMPTSHPIPGYYLLHVRTRNGVRAFKVRI